MSVPLYLVDTHALYWHEIGSARLSPAAVQVFGDASAGRAVIVVSHIALAELYFLFQKYKQPHLFKPMVARMQSSRAFRLEALTLGDLEELPSFAEIPEMHDRLIAIQAKRLGATIITIDPSIRSSPQVSCLW